MCMWECNEELDFFAGAIEATAHWLPEVELLGGWTCVISHVTRLHSHCCIY